MGHLTDPNIALQTRVGNTVLDLGQVGQSFTNSLIGLGQAKRAAQASEREAQLAPLRQQLLQQEVTQGQAQAPLQQQLLQAEVTGAQQVNVQARQEAERTNTLLNAGRAVDAFKRRDIQGVQQSIAQAFAGHPDIQQQQLAEFQADPQRYINRAQDLLTRARGPQKPQVGRFKEVDGRVLDTVTGTISGDAPGVSGVPKRVQALVKGLPEDVQAEGIAAFELAGGGKDGVKALNEVIKNVRAQKTETQKINVKRIGELQQGQKARAGVVRKATQFRRAFQSGAESGTTRTALSFIPGVFSDQAEFDQKFNAFSEVAARQKLKAAGEIRPTDADVEGMKRAIFGIGRDEPVNIQLLDEFIQEQQALDDELDDLRTAKEAGRLDVFTGSVATATGGAVENLSDDELLNF